MTIVEENVATDAMTLGQRLAEGPLPLADALHCAAMLAEAIRQVHDSGRTCGLLLPSNISIPASGRELALAPVQDVSLTPYTAPEILLGNPPDALSDIFAFGAIVYEMVVGERAFPGDDPDALAASLANYTPMSSKNPGVDHLVANCIAKNPAARFQCMQKVAMEFKLLSFTAPRAEPAGQRQNMRAALRAETQQLETRLAAIAQAHEQALNDIRQAAAQAIEELRAQLSIVQSELALEQARSASLEAQNQGMLVNIEQLQQAIVAIDEGMVGVHDSVDLLSQGAADRQEYVGARIRDLDQALKSQGNTLASLAVGQKQTDDVVEGVVGAMQLLHTMIVDRAEDFA